MSRALCCLALASGGFAQAPQVATMQLEKGTTCTGTLLVDIDRDGRDDLVLACRDKDDKRRELHVHLRGDGSPAFAPTPSRPPYALESDVVAFTYADCLPPKGRELVLVTPERVVAVTFADDGTPSYTPLAEHRCVWPAAANTFVVALQQARHDLDGDGKDDLVLPQPDGALWLPLHGGTPVPFALPAWKSPLQNANGGGGGASMQGGGMSLQLNLGGRDGDDDGEDRQPLVRLRQRTPPTRVLDLDGDGRADLMTIRNDRVIAMCRSADGSFTRVERALPLPGDRLALFDPAFDVQLLPIDGDAIPDLVLTTSARRDEEVEVRIDLFRTRADGTWPERPDSRLRLQTLARAPQLVDVDGDGRTDVVAVTLRTASLRSLTGDGPKSLEAQLNVFGNDGERFVQPARLAQVLQLPTGDDSNGNGSPFVHVLAGSGGTPGALLLQEGDRLQQRPLTADGARLQLGKATVDLPLPAKARLRATEAGEVLVRSEQEVQHVRTR